MIPVMSSNSGPRLLPEAETVANFDLFLPDDRPSYLEKIKVQSYPTHWVFKLKLEVVLDAILQLMSLQLFIWVERAGSRHSPRVCQTCLSCISASPCSQQPITDQRCSKWPIHDQRCSKWPIVDQCCSKWPIIDQHCLSHSIVPSMSIFPIQMKLCSVLFSFLM